MNRRTILVVVAVAFVLGATTLYLTALRVDAGSGSQQADAFPTAPTAIVGPESTDATRAQSATTVARQPLPLPDAALAVIYPSLKTRADAGEPQASCRLAFELIRCRTLRDERAPLEAWLRGREQELDRLEFRDGANASAREQLAMAARAEACAAVPAADLDARIGEYLYRAARAGVVDAQVHYIRGHMFGLAADPDVPVRGHGFLNHPEFERWRRESPGLAQSLLDAGQEVGVLLMGQAYLNDDGPFQSLFADDAALAHAYIAISREYIGRPPLPESRFSAAERARIAAVRRRNPAARFVPDAHSFDAMTPPGLQLGETATRCQ
jgi:hypothetical protein